MRVQVTQGVCDQVQGRCDQVMRVQVMRVQVMLVRPGATRCRLRGCMAGAARCGQVMLVRPGAGGWAYYIGAGRGAGCFT